MENSNTEHSIRPMPFSAVADNASWSTNTSSSPASAMAIASTARRPSRFSRNSNAARMPLTIGVRANITAIMPELIQPEAWYTSAMFGNSAMLAAR